MRQDGRGGKVGDDGAKVDAFGDRVDQIKTHLT